MLQRALCSGGSGQQQQQRGQYRTVLTRESPDSGLELDRMENGGGTMALGMGLAPRAEMEEEGEEGEELEETDEDKKKRPSSLGRLLSSLLPSRPSLSHSMFDFPSPSPLLGPLDPNGYAQSPISQLSRANAALMAENQQLGNRIEELEHSLRDHVAHLNSVYFTLHHRHGFDALQLPEGELVQLSQFKGPEVVLLTLVHSPPSSHEGHQQQQQQQLLANRRHRLQQQIRHKQQPNQQNGTGPQIQDSHSPSISAGSSCSFVSASSDSSLDPVEMFHQLCIRPKAELAEDDREQIQAYVDWLKGGGAGGGNGKKLEEEQHNEANRLLLAKFRAQQVQAQVQQSNGGSGQSSASSSSTIGHVHFGQEQLQAQLEAKNGRQLLNGWRNARSETAGTSQPGGGGDLAALENGHSQQLCAQLSEPSRSVSPRFGGGSSATKSQRIRSQFPTNGYMQTRRTSHTLGGSYGAALLSGNHSAAERSPRRGGIGLVSACRNTMRVERAVNRNLI